MSTHARQRVFIAAACATVLLLAAFAIVFAPGAQHRKSVRRETTGRVILGGGRKAIAKRTVQAASALRNIDPEKLDPALRREHRELLRSRPLEQHLPYRDREIGVTLVNSTSGGQLVLLVSYLHSQGTARKDVRRLMASYHDPGGEYLIRYRPVFK
jgi:hypothetical protein